MHVDVLLMGDPRVAAVPVEECGEQLRDLRGVPDLLLHPLKAEPSGAYARLRSGLVDRLLDAQAALPAGFRLLLVEGLRPATLQAAYYDDYRRELLEADPTLAEEASHRLASRYVSPPAVAPHVSGAAIDLTLADDGGTELDLGTAINATPEASAGACYFAAEVSAEARHHRTMLAASLEAAGLVNYPTEWWHWSYGDRYWAVVTGAASARYGSVPDTAVGA